MAVLLGVAVVLIALYGGFAIHYWLTWPDWLRRGGSWAFPAVLLFLWFAPGGGLWRRRVVALGLTAALAAAFLAKEPVERDWIALQSESARAEIDGDLATIANFRDAVHRSGMNPEVRWTTETFDLAQITGVDLIIQPFGNFEALAHVMLSFGFADGRHVVVSVEARRVVGGRFDPLAGLFRHERLYIELGTERDLLGERLARTPPAELQIFPVLRGPVPVRVYFERILDLVNEIETRPRFYSTLRESCMTTLMNLAPESFLPVPWSDIRRWVPGYALSLFQQVGLVDDSRSAGDLRQMHRLRDGIASPQDFPGDAAWSAYLRGGVAP